jgi:hypothetical protein
LGTNLTIEVCGEKKEFLKEVDGGRKLGLGRVLVGIG